MILVFVTVTPGLAFSQVPTLLGFYEGSSTNTVFGCSTSMNNRTTVGSGFVDVTDQPNEFFNGDGEFTATVEGFTVREVLTFSGVVDSFGNFSGTADSEAFVDGDPAGSGSSPFTGVVSGNELSIQFPGGPVGIDNCSQTGALIEVSTNCGNGFLDVGEQCDDGNREPFDGCSEFCVVPEPSGNASALVALASIYLLVVRGPAGAKRSVARQRRGPPDAAIGPDR